MTHSRRGRFINNAVARWSCSSSVYIADGKSSYRVTIASCSPSARDSPCARARTRVVPRARDVWCARECPLVWAPEAVWLRAELEPVLCESGVAGVSSDSGGAEANEAESPCENAEPQAA